MKNLNSSTHMRNAKYQVIKRIEKSEFRIPITKKLSVKVEPYTTVQRRMEIKFKTTV